MNVILFLLLGFCSLGASFTASAERDRPNFVFILTDDQRFDSLGCVGNSLVKTPNSDRLAKAGVMFTNHFVTTPICSVSRASIFTGQHLRRHQIADFATTFTPKQWEETYPALLRKHGYRTGFIGKFGVGNPHAIAAMKDDFDYWHGLPGQAGQFFIDPKNPNGRHATARFGDRALEFLTGCSNSQPFCLSISFNAPHARDKEKREFEPDRRDEELYRELKIPQPRTATEEQFNKLPDFVQNSEARKRWEKRFATPEMFQSTMRDYYRLVTGIDREVGRIVKQLGERGLDENTIIIFTSDNGWFAGERGLADKWFIYEESIRVPLIIYDPRRPVSKRGYVMSGMTLNIDLAPTILSMAGLPIPTTMQGRTLEPLMNGEGGADWRKAFYFEHQYLPASIPPSEGVRTARWAYAKWLPPNPESEVLFDLLRDPFQQRNLAGEESAESVLREMREETLRLRAEAE